MKIEKVSWSGHIPYASFLNHRPGFDAFLEEGEDPVEALLKLKALADEFHKRAYPNPQQDDESIHSSQIENRDLDVNDPVATTKEVRIGVMAKDILSCKDIKILETYRFIKDTNPELKNAYETRFTQLQER